MQHIGRFMEVPANAMATEIPHHAEAVLFHMHLNGVPDIAQSRPRADRGNALHHAIIRHIHEQLGLGGWLTGCIHATGIAMPAIQDDGDVNIDDVAIGQHAVPGNAMADHVIDRSAGRFRVAPIA